MKYEELLKLCDNEAVEYGVSLSKDLGKDFVLGQTRYVCRYGTLSDGHEKFGPAQRFFQAKKELYNISLSIVDNRALAMEAQAGILEAEECLASAKSRPDELRAQSKLIRGKNQLKRTGDMIKDQLRQADEYLRVIHELEAEVRKKFPEGIEQAEPEHWKEVAEYRMIKQRSGEYQRLDNIPMDPVSKARFGAEHGRLDALAPLIVEKRELFNPSENNFLEFIKRAEEEPNGARRLK